MGDVSVERDAVRVLCVLYFCGKTGQMHLRFGDDEDYTHTIDSENDFQKIDFWLRYPDHFAAALLRRCAPGESLFDRADKIKQIIRRIFQDQEPDINYVSVNGVKSSWFRDGV